MQTKRRAANRGAETQKGPEHTHVPPDRAKPCHFWDSWTARYNEHARLITYGGKAE